MSSRNRLFFRITLYCAIALSLALLILSLVRRPEQLAEEVVLLPASLAGALRQNGLILAVGAMLLALGAVLLLATLMGTCFHLPLLRSAALFGGIMLVGGVWTLTGCGALCKFLPYPDFFSLLGQVNMYLLPVFTAMFARSFVKSRLRIALDIDAWLLAGFLLLGCGLQLAGAADLRAIQSVGNVPILLTFALCLVCLFHEARQKDGKSAYYTLLSMLPLGVGVAADVFNYYLRYSTWNNGTAIGFLFFAVMQVAILFNGMQENAKRSLQLENDLLQNRVAMMLSQIQPHFLYNSLTAIKQLCLDDPARAEEAIGDFAGYLRMNLDSLSKKDRIPLLRELDHVERYIRLEQMRFGERVRICYDLRYTGFAVPTLTVQPLVENAVRYGITKKPEGGTVTIYADEMDADFLVRVSDDGVGFDPAARLSDERSHIGLENVKSRVAALCEGTVTVESNIGVGTSVTIRIPKKEADAI